MKQLGDKIMASYYLTPTFWGIISAVLLLLVIVLSIALLPTNVKQKLYKILSSCFLVFMLVLLVILRIPSPDLAIKYFVASFVVTIFVTLLLGLIITTLFSGRGCND